MDKQLTNLYISRILSGSYFFFYNNQQYKLIYPDISIKHEAEQYAALCYEDNKFNDWIYEDNIVYFLIDTGLWHLGGDDQLKKIETQIDDYKVQLYENSLNPPKQKQIRKSLDSLRKTYNKLFNIRHSFDHLTPQGFAELLKNQYILINSIFTIDGNKLFNDILSIDYAELNNISTVLSEYAVDISVFRALARNDIWRSYWSANKDYLFDKPTINWTDEQRTLVVLTRMYDSAHEHPECPSDHVFEDDDMFDGWMIQQRRESEKNRNKNRTDKLLEGKKLDKANEIFIMAQSKEEAKSIYGLNDSNSLNTIRERNAVVNKNKEIKEQELPDIQRSLQVKQNQQFMEARKARG